MNRRIAQQAEVSGIRNNGARAALLFLLVVLTLSLTACGPGRDKSRKASIDWSRGVELARGAVGGIDILAEDDGSSIHMVWPSAVSSQVRIRYMQLDAQADLVLDQYLEMETAWPRNGQLADAQGDRLHFIWANRLGGERSWELWHGLIDTQSGELGEAKRISPDGVDVGSFAIVADGSKGVYVFWDAVTDPGIEGLHMDSLGEIDDGPLTIIAEGASPSVAMDRSGDLHFAWFEGISVTYAKLPAGDLAAVEGTAITTVPLGIGDSVYGPEVASSDGWVYIVWSLSSLSGLEPGTAKGFHVAFPENAPRELVPDVVMLVPFEEQTYEPFEGAYNLTELAEPTVAPYGSTYVENPSILAGDLSALAVAISMEQDYRMDSYLQIAILIFEDGEFIGYQVATKTASISVEPVIAADDADNLYLAWREAASGDRVYFATTSLVGREALDSVDGSEVMRILITASLEGFASFGFFPFAFFWLVPGLVILGAVELFGKETDVDKPLPLVFFIISLLIYQAMKLTIVPTFFSYVPFSAWVDIPEALGSVLRFAVPLGMMGIGLLISWWISWRRDNRSAILYFFVTGGVDAVLTLLIYGVNLLGAF